VALAVCAAAALLEGVLAGRGVKQRFAELRLPSFSPPFAIWVSIGIVYYLICFLILHRLLIADSYSLPIKAAFALVVGVMLSNAAWNHLFFRRQSLRASFVALFPYGALVLTLAGLLLWVDPVGLTILLPYLLYLAYVTWWTYRLWQSNRPPEWVLRADASPAEAGTAARSGRSDSEGRRG
jgi:tryptophan-rich sensory protein